MSSWSRAIAMCSDGTLVITLMNLNNLASVSRLYSGLLLIVDGKVPRSFIDSDGQGLVMNQGNLDKNYFKQNTKHVIEEVNIYFSHRKNGTHSE